MWVSVKHQYVETLFYFNILQSYITFGSVFNFMFWRSWACILVRFRHKLYIARFRERSWFGLKYQVLLSKAPPDMNWYLIQNIWFCCFKWAGTEWYMVLALSNFFFVALWCFRYWHFSQANGLYRYWLYCYIIVTQRWAAGTQTDTQAAGIKRALSTDHHKGLWYF